MSDACGAAPALRIVRGGADATDVAVLTALIAARSLSATPAHDTAIRGGWSDPSRALAQLPLPGPNAWRASAR